MSRLCALISARLLKICVIFTRFTAFVCRIRERKIAKLWKTIKKALFRFKPFLLPVTAKYLNFEKDE